MKIKNKKSLKIAFLIIAIVLTVILIISIAGMYKFNYLASKPGYDVDGNKMEITSFEECEEAGYAIMESYPEQCSDGKNTFIRDISQDPENIKG